MNKKLSAKAVIFREIRIGSKCRFRRYISRKDVGSFASLTGDFNPLHLDEAFCKNTPFKKPIVHGMLAASLFSALIGMYCPGRYSLILSQEIKYLKPIYPGSDIEVTGEIINKIESIRVVILKMMILGRGRELLVEGTAKVKMMR